MLCTIAFHSIHAANESVQQPSYGCRQESFSAPSTRQSRSIDLGREDTDWTNACCLGLWSARNIQSWSRSTWALLFQLLTTILLLWIGLCVVLPVCFSSNRSTVFDHVSHEESHVSHVPSCSQCGLQRWILLLHPQGHHVPDGDLHLLPHQQQGPKFAEEQEEYL